MIAPLYATILEAEKEKGMSGSLKVLEKFLFDNGAALATFNETMKKLDS